jgi:non-specific serine/threonine protein kinase
MNAALAERLQRPFAKGSGYGLVQLGAAEVDTPMPAAFGYWRDFASRYVAAVAARESFPIPVPPERELVPLVLAPPVMTGAEYLTVEVLTDLWGELDAAFRKEHSDSSLSVEDFLKLKNPAWNLVGRIHLNLAENRNDDEAPFAFLATYTHRLTTQAKAQHIPLGHALTEYAGAGNKERLLSLLLPVQRAAEKCGWLKTMVDTGEVFHPLRWTPEEAFQLLTDLPKLESAGVIVRVPSSWRGMRPSRPGVSAKVGGKPPSELGVEALLDFHMEVTLDGERLTPSEIAQLLSSSKGLQFIRGRWIEVDGDKLAKLLAQFQSAEEAAANGQLTFVEAMRLVSGADMATRLQFDEETREWAQISPGPWLAQMLTQLRDPNVLDQIVQIGALRAKLRAYQETGVKWLYLLSSLNLGACLADDMGLGKTMQLLALILAVKAKSDGSRRPHLLIAPSSLLANWMAEIERYAPSLRVLMAHPSITPATDLQNLDDAQIADFDLVITSYTSLSRIQRLTDMQWHLAVIDEAQAIKNPAARQTRTVKQIRCHARIALTGTPVENRLGDLWSIFDFINPGLLGSAKEFSAFAKHLAERPHNPYAPLRNLVAPYILRRLKTDKSVIADLPEKTEIKAFCQLSRKQAALYQDAVKELAQRLEKTEEGIERKGLVLSFLMRFKQICNHPSHWLGDGRWREVDSGKLMRLREIVETVWARQEKMLVFTQFRETTAPLAAFLESVIGRRGLILHGGTPVRNRQSLVRQFQEDEQLPFFILSLKAGGAGLNLTAASHVIHFDRWWNPAVENQATDRAFRIGQTKNVLVQKFVCRGTVEDKIDALMEAKGEMAKQILTGGGELALTEMNDEELLKLVALDLRAAVLE